MTRDPAAERRPEITRMRREGERLLAELDKLELFLAATYLAMALDRLDELETLSEESGARAQS